MTHCDGPVVELQVGCPLASRFDPEHPGEFYGCACWGACRVKVRVRERFALFHVLAGDLVFLGQRRQLGLS